MQYGIINVEITPLGQNRVGGTTKLSAWNHFIDMNKRFCKGHLQPRLYPVSHMTALDYWLRRRTAELPEGGTLLEFGCGRTFRSTKLLGDQFSKRFATDIVDVQPHEVPGGVDFRRCTTTEIPFAREQFDVVVIRSVIEHLENPARTFSELARVTRPGGLILMNLPNKWDYVSVLARLSGRFKSSILKNVVRTAWEDFPVLYRCNTRRALVGTLEGTNLTIEQFRPLPAQPSYLSFFVPLYILGALYQFGISILSIDVLQPSFVVLLRKRNGTRP